MDWFFLLRKQSDVLRRHRAGERDAVSMKGTLCCVCANVHVRVALMTDARFNHAACEKLLELCPEIMTAWNHRREVRRCVRGI